MFVKNLSDPIGLLSSLIFSGYIYSCLLIIGLSSADILLILGVNILAYFLVGLPLSSYLFPFLFDKYQSVFPHFNESFFLEQGIAGKARMLQALYGLPSSRAIFLIYVSIIKVLPVGITLVYFCDHGLSNMQVWLYFISFEVFIIPLSSGVAFIELHILITDMIKKLHNKYDLGPLFKSCKPEGSVKRFFINEHSSFILCFITFVVQICLLWMVDGQFQLEKLIWVLLMGVVVLSRVYILYRNYLMKGILELEQTYYDIGSKKKSYIPLSSSPLLSRFQNTFNNLLFKLEKYEAGVMKWIMRESEEGRFRVIGEISASIGHSIKGPIHAIYFSLDELMELSIEDQKVAKHLNYIRENIKRIEQLSNSLNNNLRNPDGRKYTHLSIAHHEVITILRHEFVKIDNVQFKLIGLERPRKLKILHRDIIHIVYNLYKNSLKNFEENQVEFPQIILKFVDQKNELVSFQFIDNGTGLSQQDFENFTSLNFESVLPESFRQGLGLRLTKHILEKNGGSMNYVPTPSGRGTSFILAFLSP